MIRIDTSPADVGMDEEKLTLLREDIETDIESGLSDGSVILIARRGKIVMHEAIGFADRKAGRKIKTDDVLPVMSLTKQLTAATVFRFIDRGQVTLTTRIAEVIPEFACNGKERVTIRDTLSHQAGLPMQHPVEDWSQGNEAYVAKICAMPPELAADGVVNYHAGAAHAILGEVVRRLDDRNRSLTQIMADEILVPTGMTDTALTLIGRNDLADRSAPITMCDDSKETIPQQDIERIAEICATVEFPAGGAVSTAYDQYRFAEMFRLGGALNGVRVLSPAIIKAATTIQTGTKLSGLYKASAENNFTEPFPANIGLSFYVRGEGVFLASMGTLSSPSTFGGSGFGGQLFWVDPERQLTFVHLVVGYPQLYKSRKRSQRLSDLVISAVSD
ncbi:serine hydrolase domain-containing protein [Bradyrhizobium sp. Leo170]|uniref:serine hydrolase domain-containing protein n=1 Tax=Bradyrhizobium sp. Leo170 TaxID=1571199 RepID=UPI0013EEDE6E|nr:serine hydrolase domain-containing protein [Bradyrhizobium sp. Leo170]